MARKLRIGRNRPDRVDTREAYWASRYAQARGPQAIAAVEYDRLRVEASKLPARDQEQVWRALATYMAQERERIEDRRGRSDTA